MSRTSSERRPGMAERTKAEDAEASEQGSAADALDEAANGSSTPISDARHKVEAENPGTEADAEATADVTAEPEASEETGEPGTDATADAVADPEDAKPKVKTAADIVAENEAAKSAAAKAGAAATVAKTAVAKPAATAKPVPKPAPKPASKPEAKPDSLGKAAVTATVRGVTRIRNLVASAIWLIAVICAAVLALGALFTALSQTNENNTIVSWVLNHRHNLIGPFDDVFKLETAKNTLLVNWGIAAIVYLAVGKIAERIIRP